MTTFSDIYTDHLESYVFPSDFYSLWDIVKLDWEYYQHMDFLRTHQSCRLLRHQLLLSWEQYQGGVHESMTALVDTTI